MHTPAALTALALTSTMLVGGCSVQRYAINSLSDVLTNGGSTFERDGDPALVGEALPFALKLIEALLAEQPDHRGLLLAAARGYVLYSYAFVARPAEQSRRDDLTRARALQARAGDLFLRAHDYAGRALEIDYPGMQAALHAAPFQALASVGENPGRDTATLYWNAVSLALAISASRNEPALLARLPEVEALLARALELDESWNEGALHELAINLASTGSRRLSPEELEGHYRRALSLSHGARVSVYVTYAEAMAVPRQDRDLFTDLLNRALAVDLDAAPDQRLLNTISKDRAQWLLESIDELFL